MKLPGLKKKVLEAILIESLEFWLDGTQIQTLLDLNGMPLEIRYEEEGLSAFTFSKLVRRYSGDMSPRSMLDELMRVGVVIETEPGWLKGFAARLRTTITRAGQF